MSLRITAALVREKGAPLVVRVAAPGICQTDIHGRDDYFGLSFPCVFGAGFPATARARGGSSSAAGCGNGRAPLALEAAGDPVARDGAAAAGPHAARLHPGRRAAREVFTEALRVSPRRPAPCGAAHSLVRVRRYRPRRGGRGKRPHDQLPDVPTTAEAGVKGAEAPLWFGLWGPAGMPGNVVKKINPDVRKALAEPAVKERLVKGGNETMDMSPREFARMVGEQIDDYTRVLKAAGVKPQ